MAAAEAVVDVMLEPGFLPEVERISAILRAGVERVCAAAPAIVEEVRGMGMMLGIKCRIPNTDVTARLLKNGLLTIGAGDNVVRLLPPLIISEAEVKSGLDILAGTFSELTQ